MRESFGGGSREVPLSEPRADVEKESLPRVSLEIGPDPFGFQGAHELEASVTKREQVSIKDADGNLVGTASLSTAELPEGKVAWLGVIHIKEEMQRRGFGKATYLELVRLLGDVKLISGWRLSDGAHSIWEWMCANGMARKTKEGITNKEEGYSTDQYEVANKIEGSIVKKAA